VFAPQSSLIKAAFQHCSPGWLIQPPTTAQTWRTDALRLEAEGYFVAAGPSTDDTHVATCSNDGTVRIWNPKTVVCLTTSDPSEEYGSEVALAFSTCNSLAKASFSGSYDKDSINARTLKIAIFHSIELRDTKEVTCAALGGYAAKLAFSPDDHDVLYVAISGKHNAMFILDVWSIAIGVGTMECLWTRTSVDGYLEVLDISAELKLIACLHRSLDHGTLDILDLHSGASMRRTNPMDMCFYTGPCAFHGTNIIAAISDEEKMSASHFLQSLDIETGHQRVIHSSTRDISVFAMAHGGDKIVLAPFMGTFAEIYNISQESATGFTPQRDSVIDLTISVDGETLLAAYSDRFEVQTLRGGVTFTRPVIWSKAEVGITRGPRISRSHDGAFVAARTCTVQGANGITVWHVASGEEIFQPCVTHGRLAPIFSHSTGLLACDDENAKWLIIWDIFGKKETLTFGIPEGTTLHSTEDMIQFAQDDKTMFTSKGLIRVETGDGVWTPWPEHVTPPRRIRSRISYEHEWVKYDGDDLLWVPPHHRPLLGFGRFWDASEGTIALWNSDSMVVMRIADPNH
jgi:WD40 repeat protein